MALRLMRTARMVMCHDFCEELQNNLSLDAIKLELLFEVNNMRRRAYLLPRDSMVLRLFCADAGEHQFANYKEDQVDQDAVRDQFFFDETKKKIKDFWQLPNFKEIGNLTGNTKDFKEKNHKEIYKYFLGYVSDNIDEEDKETEFACDNQK